VRLIRRAALAIAATAACALAVSCSYDPPVASVPKASPLPPSYVTGLGSQWALSFDASFPGSRLNTSVWGTCYPWQSQQGCTNFGNSNEYEWYTPSQDQVSGGALHLVPQRVPTQGLASNAASKQYSYRSGMVTTSPSFNFQYGYVQVVARVPYGKGLWPALWLLPSNGEWPPEIDMIEHYGDSAISFQHLHSRNFPVQMAFEATPDLAAGWHVFGLYWSRYRVIWYIDGQRVFDTVHGIPQLPMYFLADLAVYQQVQQNWNPVSDAMDIRSVRVWQAKTYPRTGHPLAPG
jgi:beta-glucanase (GH16 family)